MPTGPNTQVLRPKGAVDKVEQALRILASLASIVVPFVILWIGNDISNNQRQADADAHKAELARAEAASNNELQARDIEIASQAGPYLFDPDANKNKYGILILNQLSSISTLLPQLLQLAHSANPAVAHEAAAAIVEKGSIASLKQAALSGGAFAEDASSILADYYYIEVYTARTESEAKSFVENYDQKVRAISRDYTLQQFKTPAGLVKVAVSPAMKLMEARALVSQIESAIGVSDAYLKPAQSISK